MKHYLQKAISLSKDQRLAFRHSSNILKNVSEELINDLQKLMPYLMFYYF